MRNINILFKRKNAANKGVLYKISLIGGKTAIVALALPIAEGACIPAITLYKQPVYGDLRVICTHDGVYPGLYGHIYTGTGLLLRWGAEARI